MVTGFYGSNDPTNSVKALKEDRSKGSGFNPIRSTPPCSQWYNNKLDEHMWSVYYDTLQVTSFESSHLTNFFIAPNCKDTLWHCLTLLGGLAVFWFYATAIIFVDNNNNKKEKKIIIIIIISTVRCMRKDSSKKRTRYIPAQTASSPSPWTVHSSMPTAHTHNISTIHSTVSQTAAVLT